MPSHTGATVAVAVSMSFWRCSLAIRTICTDCPRFIAAKGGAPSHHVGAVQVSKPPLCYGPSCDSAAPLPLLCLYRTGGRRGGRGAGAAKCYWAGQSPSQCRAPRAIVAALRSVCCVCGWGRGGGCGGGCGGGKSHFMTGSKHCDQGSTDLV